MRIASAAATVVAALGLAACGSGGSASSTVSPASSTTAATSTVPTTTAVTTTTTTTTTSVTTTAGPSACVASGLHLTYLGGLGATGHGELGFELTNVGTATCKTFGYPGIQFLDKSGRPLPTIPTHTTRDFFGAAPEVEISLAPGQSASFRLGVTHGAASPVGCTTAYGIQVIPPDDTATLRATLGDGAYECRTATVSPVRPGRSAFP